MEAEPLEALIARFVSDVEIASIVLRGAIGAERLRLGRRAGGFARMGRLPGGGKYQFHGSGCRVELPGREADFDWANDGRIDIFNAWELWNYSQQPIKFSSAFVDVPSVQSAIDDLVARGVLSRLPSPMEYYYVVTKAVPKYLC